jgi:hypothetical protein
MYFFFVVRDSGGENVCASEVTQDFTRIGALNDREASDAAHQHAGGRFP